MCIIKRERRRIVWKGLLAGISLALSTLLFANNAALNHVGAFCDPGIICVDVGVYSAHYKVSSSVQYKENMIGELRITGKLCTKDCP